MPGSPGRVQLRVYYQDVDSLAIVYHANYLKYLERGRVEFLSEAGFAPWALNEQGILMAIYRAELAFLAPARLGDVCEVVTSVADHTAHRLVLSQLIRRAETRLLEATMSLVFLNRDLTLRETPADMATWLNQEWKVDKERNKR